MFIPPKGETSWPGKHLASSRSLSAWKSTPTPVPTCNLRGVAATSSSRTLALKAVVLGAGAVAACRSVTPTPRRFAKGLRKCAEALQENDPATAEVGLRRLSAARRSEASLDAEIQAARNTARWSLRGRFAAREIGAAALRYDCKSIQLYASTLLLGQALASALREVNVAFPTLSRQQAKRT
jgi:hypothetical protein